MGDLGGGKVEQFLSDGVECSTPDEVMVALGRVFDPDDLAAEDDARMRELDAAFTALGGRSGGGVESQPLTGRVGQKKVTAELGLRARNYEMIGDHAAVRVHYVLGVHGSRDVSETDPLFPRAIPLTEEQATAADFPGRLQELFAGHSDPTIVKVRVRRLVDELFG